MSGGLSVGNGIEVLPRHDISSCSWHCELRGRHRCMLLGSRGDESHEPGWIIPKQEARWSSRPAFFPPFFSGRVMFVCFTGVFLCSIIEMDMRWSPMTCMLYTYMTRWVFVYHPSASDVKSLQRSWESWDDVNTSRCLEDLLNKKEPNKNWSTSQKKSNARPS